MAEQNPEIGRSITVDGITTNYHDVGEGPPVLLIHGSGSGVSAFAALVTDFLTEGRP